MNDAVLVDQVDRVEIRDQAKERSLDEELRISGRVVDPLGSALVKIRVLASWRESRKSEFGQTDDYGRFCVAIPRGVTEVCVYSRPSQGLAGFQVLLDVDSGQECIDMGDLVVVPAASIEVIASGLPGRELVRNLRFLDMLADDAVVQTAEWHKESWKALIAEGKYQISLAGLRGRLFPNVVTARRGQGLVFACRFLDDTTSSIVPLIVDASRIEGDVRGASLIVKGNDMSEHRYRLTTALRREGRSCVFVRLPNEIYPSDVEWRLQGRGREIALRCTGETGSGDLTWLLQPK
ncbi:MAG: hypothetical protein ACE37K_20325 [Planctomycetota bacterium]